MADSGAGVVTLWQKGLPGFESDMPFAAWRYKTRQPGAACSHDYPMGACGYCDAEKRMGLRPLTAEESAPCKHGKDIGECRAGCDTPERLGWAE